MLLSVSAVVEEELVIVKVPMLRPVADGPVSVATTVCAVPAVAVVLRLGPVV
jgi:hypothetical protein